MADIVTAETTAFWQKGCTITGGDKWCSCCHCAFVNSTPTVASLSHTAQVSTQPAETFEDRVSGLRTLMRRVPIVTLVDLTRLINRHTFTVRAM